MLATLLRHTGRLDDACGQLDRLERLENASKWELEIGRERELIRQARASGSDEQSPPAEQPPVSPPAAVADAA